jgi:hypothetical protein
MDLFKMTENHIKYESLIFYQLISVCVLVSLKFNLDNDYFPSKEQIRKD